MSHGRLCVCVAEGGGGGGGGVFPLLAINLQKFYYAFGKLSIQQTRLLLEIIEWQSESWIYSVTFSIVRRFCIRRFQFEVVKNDSKFK